MGKDMIQGIMRRFRVFHIKIVIGHLDQKRGRIFIREAMPKQFNMIINQALIFILVLEPNAKYGRYPPFKQSGVKTTKVSTMKPELGGMGRKL